MRVAAVVIAAVGLLVCGCKESKTVSVEDGQRPQTSVIPERAPLNDPWKSYPNIRFASEGQLKQHFEKHGSQFGATTPDQYLKKAQYLRDRPKDETILEAARPDRVLCRYDKVQGSFLAYNANRTIRTFFKPNDGERYFYRQMKTQH